MPGARGVERREVAAIAPSYAAVWAKAFAASSARAAGVRVAAVRELVEDARVVGGIAHDGDARVVLRRGTHHRRPADVDVLDDVLVRRTARRRRLLEGVQVDDDQIDGLGPKAIEVAMITLAPRQDAAVHARMQGLHPPVHHLGRTV